MVTTFQVLQWAHWGGLALIVVGYALSFGPRAIHPIMVWGARVQFLLGLALVAIVEMGGLMALNHMWVGVKFILALAILALCEIARARTAKGRDGQVFMHIAGALTLVTALYALLGH